MAVVFIGALNVGSISTPWTGEIRPSKRGLVEEIDLRPEVANLHVEKGDLLGWFNMGSTVILLLPKANWRADLKPGDTVRMGESLSQHSHG
jgi:phosphatidylserine decarboxylase